MLLFLLLAACVPPPIVRRLEPGFDGRRICRLEGNVLPGGPLGAVELRLDPERADSLGNAPRFALLLDARGADDFRARRGEPLIIVVDGDSSKLPRADSTVERRVLDGERASARLRFQATPELLRGMAAGGTVQVELPGASPPVRARLGTAGSAALQRFLRECGGSEPAPPADSAAVPPPRG